MPDDELECMEDVLRHYGRDVRLTSRWKDVKCPFHDDASASASACLSGFKCHACPVKGNCITVIMEVEKCDVPSALSLIERITGNDYRRVSEPITRKSWGIPPFSERDNGEGSEVLSSGLRKLPDLW